MLARSGEERGPPWHSHAASAIGVDHPASARLRVGSRADDCGMSSSNSPRGVIAAALGALLALGSLWLPWYTVRISDAFREMLGSLGAPQGGAAPTTAGAGASGADGLAGAFAGLFKGLAAVMPEEITANGWTAMDGGDIAIAAAAGAMIFVVLLASNGGSSIRVDRGVAGRLIAFAGLVVTAVAAYHFVSTPGGGVEQLSGTVDREPGIFAAIAGGLMMLAGGLATAAGPRAAERAESSGFSAQPGGEPAAAAAFAPPADPFAMSEPASAAHGDPFASPQPQTGIAGLQPFATAPDPAAGAAPDPFAAPAPVDAGALPDPFAAPQPVAASDPFAAAPEHAAAPSYSPLGMSGEDGSHVPDWSGFSEPEPGLTPAREPAPQPGSVEQPVSARPAGVSIPPPGWTGAA